MKRFAPFLLCIFAGFLPTQFSYAQASDLTDNQILKQLESSGELDKAVQRSLDRIKQKELEERRIAAQKENELRAEKAKSVRKVNPKTDYIYGKVNAPISIILFSDFECPYCKRFHETPQDVVDSMPDQVNLVWRNFPLSFHDPMATKEAGAAICAYQQGGNTAFWEYSNAVMELTKLNGQGMPAKEGEDAILNLAKLQQLDITKFKVCLVSPQTKKLIDADKENGSASGIQGTPGVIVLNNKTGTLEFLIGAVPIDVLKAAVSKVSSKP